MGELRARDIENKGELGALVELRCQEAGCNRLLLRVTQAAGHAMVETHCQHCQTWAQWTLRTGERPFYVVTKKRV